MLSTSYLYSRLDKLLQFILLKKGTPSRSCHAQHWPTPAKLPIDRILASPKFVGLHTVEVRVSCIMMLLLETDPR